MFLQANYPLAKLFGLALLTAFLPMLGDTNAHAQEAMSDEDEHVRLFEEAREQQNAFFNDLRERIRNGVPVDAAAGSCKYASSILRAPPAKTVVLTFDDGPTSDLTPEVLQILKKYGIKATFFMKGDHAQVNQLVVQQVYAEGHLIGNHSWDHPNFWTLNVGTQTSEVTSTDQLLGNFLKPMKLFRYPFGNSTCATNVLVKKRLQYTGIVGWHVDSCDWAFSKTGKVTAKQARICEVAPANISNFPGHVLTEIRRNNGGIVLMHDIHTRTVAHLEEIIQGLLSEGFSFTNLDDPRMRKYFF